LRSLLVIRKQQSPAMMDSFPEADCALGNQDERLRGFEG
jgi:hypothetical protein